MFDYLIPLSPLLVPLVFFLRQALRRVDCPDCGTPLPPLVSPLRKTRRMWRVGGYLCARCGCETDSAGRKVMADAPLPLVPARQWILLSVLLLVGLGLGTVGWILTARVAAPPAAPAPPVVPPLQVPPAGPAN